LEAHNEKLKFKCRIHVVLQFNNHRSKDTLWCKKKLNFQCTDIRKWTIQFYWCSYNSLWTYVLFWQKYARWAIILGLWCREVNDFAARHWLVKLHVLIESTLTLLIKLLKTQSYCLYSKGMIYSPLVFGAKIMELSCL